jgi:hypothetical protein
MQCTLPHPEVALMLLVLTALAWGIPLARLWGQTRTVLVEYDDLPGPFDALAPDNTPEPPPTPEPQPIPELTPDIWECLPAIRSTVEEEVERIAEAVTQAQGLLRDAVAGLHQSFHGLYSQTQAQHQLVVSLMGDMTGQTTTTQSSQLTMQQFTEATTSLLQFEDIISQLLHYTEKPLGTLRSLGTVLADAAETNDSTPLLALGTTLVHQREEEQTEAHTPVAQTSVPAGDMELF